ncbi:MAG: hypothetical protein KF716_28885 [Anaerolineae bacterium]|nr:hypothetical protein [Anaerolineae bacterium]
MNIVRGRVVLKESGAGIAGILVVIYSAEPKTTTGVVTRSATPPTEEYRLVTLQTGSDGRWEYQYEDSAFQIRDPNKRRPDLFLQVLAPEELNRAADSQILFQSAARQNAGQIEEYLISISADTLTKAGVAVPSLIADVDVEPATQHVQRLKEAQEHTAAIIDGTLEVARTRVATHRARFSGFSDKLQSALSASLSTVSANVFQPERFVKPGESPATKNAAVIQQNIRDIINSDDSSTRAPTRGFISLTDDQVQQLRSHVANDGAIAEDNVQVVVGPQPTTTYLQRTDLLPICQPLSATDGPCLDLMSDTAPNTSPTPSPENPGPDTTSVTIDDIPKFIGRLINPLTAPEEQLLTDLLPVATLEGVQKSISDLDLPPSPADVPAFHDFSQLQIAFQHVWQELTDNGVLDLASDAYETIVELGGDPTDSRYDKANPLDALKLEAKLVQRALRLTPPPAVRDHRGGDTDTATASGGTVVTTTQVVNDHRADANATDPSVRLPALLSALEARMQEPYSFTIFAANSKERSINFGILNIFRQLLTPLSYQAGSLIKSIPLAPRQTQRIVITRKVTKKRFQKETERNLRINRDETSQTSRAEQEIAKRASAKTEFSYTNSATAGIEPVGSDTTTTSFKQEASKSSDDIKKSFRESVFKSAQEVTNERTTELTTETMEEFDTTETTEISNPNDEVTVTYLFYELQRRYRVHERLYRVTPVVFVAQEVPAPHEIDQDWLVTYDWILKRVILDDSFLLTLETLSQSAGAETAIAQLATNVAQQRQIVAQLRDEVAIARRIEEVQSNLLHGAVGSHTESSGLLGSLVSGAVGLVGGAVGKVEDMIFGDSADQNQANQNALKSSADEAADHARDLIFRLEREVTALNSITETYTKALQEHHTHLTEIARLRVHVKENILHYMQAIWRHEHPDQRYFRLHNVPIPTLNKQHREFRIDFDHPLSVTNVQPHTMLSRFGGRPAKTYKVQVSSTFSDQLEYKPLCEVADLDNLLGFKGNYMVFPLLESNPLTDYMMEPYIDRATGELVDPSDPAGYSLDEFTKYVCCLKDQLTADEFESLRPTLKEQFQAILTNARRNDDVLVVPSESLFIEICQSGGNLLEPYKRDQRFHDVRKVQAEVRKLEMENIRYAARLLSDEYEDPEIEKKIVVEGGTVSVTDA